MPHMVRVRDAWAWRESGFDAVRLVQPFILFGCAHDGHFLFDAISMKAGLGVGWSGLAPRLRSAPRFPRTRHGRA